MNWGEPLKANSGLKEVRPRVDELLGTYDVVNPLILTYSLSGQGNCALTTSGNLLVGYSPHVSLAGTVGLLCYFAISGHTNLAALMAVKTATSLHNIPSIIYRSIDRPHSIGNPAKSLIELASKMPFITIDLDEFDDRWFVRNLFIMDQKYSSAVGLPHAYSHYALERQGILDASLRRGVSHASDFALHRGTDLGTITDEHMRIHLETVQSGSRNIPASSKYALAMYMHERDKGALAFEEVLAEPKHSVSVADELVEYYLPALRK